MFKLVAMVAGLAVCVTPAFGQTLTAVEVYVDRDIHFGNEVEIERCHMSAADTSSIICKEGGVSFFIQTDSASKQLATLALTRCSNWVSTPEECTVSLSGVLEPSLLGDNLRVTNADIVQ